MLAEIVFPIPLKRTFHYYLPQEMELIAAPSQRVEVQLGNKNTIGYIRKICAEKDVDLSGVKRLKSVLKIIDEEPVFKEDVLLLSQTMADKWGASVGMYMGEFFANIPRDLTTASDSKQDSLKELIPFPLDGKYNNLYDYVKSEKTLAVCSVPEKIKLQVFENIAKSSLNNFFGSQILFLVPDLNAAEQIFNSFPDFLKQISVVWHAKLTQKKKRETVENVFSNIIKIVIGTRNSVFLPFSNLCLTIIDDENNTVYRNDEAEPLFNAKEVALMRSGLSKNKTVLCSDFIGVETFAYTQKDKCDYFDFTDNLDHKPNIQIENMQNSLFDIFARPVSDYLRECVLNGGKAVVISPRKGYAKRMLCANCGYMPVCPKCGPGLSVAYNSDKTQILLCEKCGKKYSVPAVCPKCGGKVFNDYGSGTQKIKEYLQKLLPKQEIFRFDGDVLSGSVKKMRSILTEFADTESAVLVGTKAALRNITPESLDLLVFINADADIKGPDFRATEKMYKTVTTAVSLLKKTGKIVLQTLEPENYVFNVLSDTNVESFLKTELEARKFFSYPPYSRLILIRFASHYLNGIQKRGMQLKGMLKPFLSEKTVQIMGPVTPFAQDKKKFFSEYYLIKCLTDVSYAKSLKLLYSMDEDKKIKHFITPDPYVFY